MQPLSLSQQILYCLIAHDHKPQRDRRQIAIAHQSLPQLLNAVIEMHSPQLLRGNVIRSL